MKRLYAVWEMPNHEWIRDKWRNKNCREDTDYNLQLTVNKRNQEETFNNGTYKIENLEEIRNCNPYVTCQVIVLWLCDQAQENIYLDYVKEPHFSMHQLEQKLRRFGLMSRMLQPASLFWTIWIVSII